MNTGDVVKIRSYDEILSEKSGMVTHNGSFSTNRIKINGTPNGTIYFNFKMKRYCGTKVTLHALLGPPGAGDWKVRENHFFWHESWFEKQDFLKDADFEL